MSLNEGPPGEGQRPGPVQPLGALWAASTKGRPVKGSDDLRGADLRGADLPQRRAAR